VGIINFPAPQKKVSVSSIINKRFMQMIYDAIRMFRQKTDVVQSDYIQLPKTKKI